MTTKPPLVASSSIAVFGRTRDPVKVKQLTSKQRKLLQAADERCMAAFEEYLQAIKDKGALEVKWDLVKTRQHPPQEPPKPPAKTKKKGLKR